MILLHAIVFISGASALILENLWFHGAGLTLGNSVWATAIVLSSFMAGLAIGNGLSARFEKRISRPLHAYVWLELAIGLTGCTLVLAFPVLTGILAPLFRQVLQVPWLVNFIRLLVAFVLMLVPTTAMGATLPMLAKYLARTDSNFGKILGGLYGANTLGSVAGVLVCELIFVPTLGIWGSGILAAILNLVAAGLALRMARRDPQKGFRRADAEGGAEGTWRLSTGTFVILAIGFLSGGILLSLEVVWFRFMVLFFDAYSINFAVMLAMVLVGIGAGGIAAALWFRFKPDAHRALPLVCFLSGVAVVASYALFQLVQRPLWRSQSVSAVFWCALVLIFPASLLSGVIFTMLGNALHREGFSEGGATGTLASLNTIGSTLGALLASFVFLPFLGMERSFFWLALAYGLAGALPLTQKAWGARKRLSGVIGIVLFVPAIALFPRGMMNRSYLEETRKAYRGDGENMVAVKESQTETIQYLCRSFLDQPEYYRLVTNNHSMASNDAMSRRYMKLYAYFPFVVHPSPKRAALICYGVGSTALALTENPALESIDVVDISKDILDLGGVVFPNSSQNPLNDPRVAVHVEDGRFFLQTTPQRFDIITGEPPPPFFAGVSNLYSREYFQLVHNALSPGGMVTYWLPVHNLTADEARGVLAAFVSVFPDATLWTGAGLNWMMVGVKPSPKAVTLPAFKAWWEDPKWSRRFHEVALDNPGMLGATFIADGARMREWIGSTPAVTDNFPRRLGARTRATVQEYYSFISFMNAPERKDNFLESPSVRALWPDTIRLATSDWFGIQASMNSVMSERSMPNVVLELHANLDNPTVIKTMFWKFRSDFDFEHRRFAEVRPKSTNEKAVFFYQAQLAIREKRFADAAKWFELGGGRDFMYHPFRVYLLFRAGNKTEGKRVGKELFDSLHSPSDRQGVMGFMGWLESLEPIASVSDSVPTTE